MSIDPGHGPAEVAEARPAPPCGRAHADRLLPGGGSHDPPAVADVRAGGGSAPHVQRLPSGPVSR